MATYVNDLRLKEIATGDESGTWGTSTNTNLELIAEAFSFGTEAITTNADTHTTTIADGSTDPGRSIYLKYTGTLDSACTITIGPNTVSKLWFIENGTSGSQNIIISQGSGASITIPPGDTKAIYSDGAGSGAAMVDAFASLSVVDLKVQDDLTVTDDLIVNGDIDLEGNMDVNGSLETDALSLNGTTVTSTAAEINLLDGSSANTVVNSKAVIYGSSGELAGTLSTAAQTNITSLGTLTTLTVDNIKIDGNDISSTDSDGDLVFKGNDGGSTITALTLDMSNAGRATFNENVTVGGNLEVSGADVTITSNIIHAGDTNTFFGFNDADTFRVVTSGSEALRVNSLQNVGINETNPLGKLHVKSADSGASADGSADELVVEGSGNSGLSILSGTSDNGTILFSDSGDSAAGGLRYEHNDDALNFRTNGSWNRLYINSSGNVGIGMDSPNATLNVNGTIRAENERFLAGRETASAPAYAFHDDADTGMFNVASNILAFSTAGSERMRILSGGTVLISTTTNEGVGGLSFSDGSNGVNVTNNTTTGAGNGHEFYVFRRNSTQIGSIVMSNTDGVTYSTSSDARLKNVLGEAKGLEIVKKLNPVNFEWKESKNVQDGLIAQEVEELIPHAVAVSEEGHYSMDYSKLVTPLIKAIQEQQEQIDALQSEINNLKGE